MAINLKHIVLFASLTVALENEKYEIVGRNYTMFNIMQQGIIIKLIVNC